MKDNWFKEISGRCPWHRNNYGQDYCEAVGASHGLRMQCRKNNCAPFFMAATIIAAYKYNEKQCNCTSEGPNTTAGCPVHGVKY